MASIGKAEDGASHTSSAMEASKDGLLGIPALPAARVTGKDLRDIRAALGIAEGLGLELSEDPADQKGEKGFAPLSGALAQLACDDAEGATLASSARAALAATAKDTTSLRVLARGDNRGERRGEEQSRGERGGCENEASWKLLCREGGAKPGMLSCNIDLVITFGDAGIAKDEQLFCRCTCERPITCCSGEMSGEMALMSAVGDRAPQGTSLPGPAWEADEDQLCWRCGIPPPGSGNSIDTLRDTAGRARGEAASKYEKLASEAVDGWREKRFAASAESEEEKDWLPSPFNWSSSVWMCTSPEAALRIAVSLSTPFRAKPTWRRDCLNSSFSSFM